MLLSAILVTAFCLAIPAQAEHCAHTQTGVLKAAKKLYYKHDVPEGQAESVFNIPSLTGREKGMYAWACDGDVSPEVKVNFDRAVVKRLGNLSGPATLTLEVYKD